MNIFWLVFVIIVYLSATAYLGYRGFRSTKSSEDYMLGGRKIHPFVMAMSYGATFISTSAIVGFGGVASLYGFSLMWLAFLNILVGVIIAFMFYGKRTRKMGRNLGAHTFPELLGKRTGSKFVQGFTGAVIFIFLPIYTAAVLIGASRIVEGLLGVPYMYAVALFSVLVASYVILGGIKGVMYSDTLQGGLMFLGMTTLLIYTYIKLGGIVPAHSALTAMADLVPENLKAIGHRGWTASPASGSPLWWVIYSSLVLGVGIGVLAQPQLVVRYMTVKSDRELNRAVLIGALFILVTVGTTYAIGPLSNVYYYARDGLLSIQVAGGNVDSVMPLFIRDTMPVWFGYVFMLVILSAGMSTLSSQFHTIGTSIGKDVYGAVTGKQSGHDRSVPVTRIGIVVSLLVTVFLGLKLGEGVIARATAIFFGLMASSFLAPYTAAIYWKRLTRKGAIAGMVSGLAVVVFAFLFLHAKEAEVFGLCKALFGRTTLLGGTWDVVDPLVLGLPVSIVFTVAVSLFTKVEDDIPLEESFKTVAD